MDANYRSYTDSMKHTLNARMFIVKCTCTLNKYPRETTVEKEAGLELMSSLMSALLPTRGAPMSTIGLYGF